VLTKVLDQPARFLAATVFCCLVNCLVFFSPSLDSPSLNSPSLDTTIGPAFADPLRAGIEQYDVAKGWIPSERLPIADWEKRVAPRLKSGLAWSDKLLPEQGSETKWVPIPAWLAGHWHIERARFVLDKTGASAPDAMNLEDDIFGFQQDRSGGYWEMLRSPVTNMTEGDQFYSRFQKNGAHSQCAQKT
jgi:hypothetical protein